ncbi:MAG: type II toxin-antitoxin system VapC family toxin [Gaiellaceae bacterium]
MTAADRAVFDASILVRSIVEPNGPAARWVEDADRGSIEAHTAVLAFTEVANALRSYVRAGAMTHDDAREALDALGILPLQLHGAALARAALTAAFELELSAYDGTYAALSELVDAPLVTADRRLAAAVPRAELVA